MEPDRSARVLVAIITSPRDLAIAREEGWYRIPVARAPVPLAAEYLAFYQTAAFGDERWSVRYYAPILRYHLTTRRVLIPTEPNHPRANERYYRLELGELTCLPTPIPSKRLRRITFIATTFGQLCRACDVRELWHPEEEQQSVANDLWASGMAGKPIR